MALGPGRYPRRRAPLSVVIRAILFDFTGVLTTSAFTALAEVETERSLAPGSLVRPILGDYGEDDGHPWKRLERGEIGLAEYFLDVTDHLGEAGINVDLADVLRRFTKLRVHDGVVDRVRGLRARGYRVGLVTNNVREASELWRRLVPLDDVFDAVVESWAVGLRKPDERIYRHALELLGGVDPAEAVLLDDAPVCVEGARRAGLYGILVEDPHAALDELEKLLAGEGGPA